MNVRSIIIKSIVVIAVIYGLANVSEGWSTLTKFTTLSNVGIGIAMLIMIITEVIEYKKTGRLSNQRTETEEQGNESQPQIPKSATQSNRSAVQDNRDIDQGKQLTGIWKYNFKFTMTAAMVFTFLVYMCILAPTSSKGFFGSYMNNNWGSLAHHVIAPVFTLIDFYINDKGFIPSIKASILTVLYPIFYVASTVLIAATGYRWSYGKSSPYNFLNFGAPVGWFGFDLSTIGKTSLGIGVAYVSIALCILFILMALLLRFIKSKN